MTPMPLRRSPRRRAPRGRSERAVVLIWFALMLTLLLGFAGFAVDLSNWWFQAERLQRAADAGAHAGVVYLPADLPGATTTARSEVAKNGFPSTGAQANATVAVNQEPNPNRLRVAVTTEVESFFVRLLGVDSVTLTREAVAEFVLPLPMGSPENKLGNDPDAQDPGTELWLGVAAPTTAKHNGDQYGARRCEEGEYSCSGAVNDEYYEDGYAFTLNVKQVPAGGQPLLIQVFDPAHVPMGTMCQSNRFPTAAQIAQLEPTFPDAATRYAGGQGPYCTGDVSINTNTAHRNLRTTFIVRRPDETPWSFTDNPLETACQPFTARSFFPTSNSYIFDMLMDPIEGSLDPSNPYPSFAKTWRRWHTICEIPANQVQTGEYIIQVRTNAQQASPLTYDSSIIGDAANMLSMRAGFGLAGAEAVGGSNITLAARGRLPIYANAVGADTKFHLARILPSDAGRVLRVTLFDVGDAATAGNFRVLAPEEYPGSFSGCSFHLDNGVAINTSPATCQVNNMTRNVFNGRLLEILVPVPEDFTCAVNQATGCWVKVQAQYPAGSNVHDFTTWTAAILGNPVRLVE